MSYQVFAKSVLQSKGYRVTKPRVLVLSALDGASKPLNAYEIAELISNQGEKVDVSTVYRILEVFKDFDLVHWSAEKQRYTACRDFDCETKEHCHHELVCRSCERFIELHIDDRQWIEDLAKLYKDWSIDKHHFELSGLCKNCK